MRTTEKKTDLLTVSREKQGRKNEDGWRFVDDDITIFDIRTLWRSGLSVIMPGCQKAQDALAGIAVPIWQQWAWDCKQTAFVFVSVFSFLYIFFCFWLRVLD